MQLSLPTGDDLKEMLQHLKNHASDMDHATLLDYLSKNIKTFPLASDTVPVGTIIERGRRNIADELFYSESQITYRKDFENIRSYGRCNKPGISLFYGLLATEELSHPRVACVFETDEYFRNPNKGNTEFTQTVGRWEVIKPIEVIVPILVGTPDFEAFFDAMSEEPPEKVSALREVVEFISNEFTKSDIPSDNDYKISAAFSEMVVNKTRSSGIMYPSVRTAGKGMCIALPSSIADEALRLEAVGTFRVYKRGNNAVMDNMYVAKVDASKNLPFSWVRVDPMDEGDREQILNRE